MERFHGQKTSVEGGDEGSEDGKTGREWELDLSWVSENSIASTQDTQDGTKTSENSLFPLPSLQDFSYRRLTLSWLSGYPDTLLTTATYWTVRSTKQTVLP